MLQAQDTEAPAWPDEIFAVLEDLDVRQVVYVPDAGHSRLITRCQEADAMTAVPLTTEEEGVALLAGTWLGGERGVLLMQSSGLGNCVNMLALTRVCRFPLLILVTMRGEPGEANPWQMPMGSIAGDVLRLSDVDVHVADAAERVAPLVAEAGAAVFDRSSAAAVLIAQHVIGVKSFEK
jgi:sulfopyruvate decarboxylase alpha subunit